MEKAISIRCTGADNFDIEDLHPFQDDIKTMTPSTLKKLENVIISQGFSEPIAVWQNDGRNWILNGHQRHTALISLRSKGWFVPPVPVALVDAADEDDARKKVITLASQFGDFNQDHLLEFVAKAKLDTEWLKNNARLAAGDFKWPVLVTPTDEDETPEPSPVEIVQRGELFILGDHRLMCGDSTNQEEVDRLTDGEIVDLIFTDPPYGLGSKKSFNDDHPEYKDDVAFDLSKLNLFKANYVIWGANYYDYLPGKRTEIGWCVWDKRPTRETWDAATRDAADRIFGQHFEIAVTNIPGIRGKMIRKTWGGFYGTAGNPDDKIIHKTQKPIELITHFLKDNHRTILDYFGGSGSTMIACEKNKRKCLMMELDPIYCGLILDRWESVTGKTACRDDGESWQSIKALRTE